MAEERIDDPDRRAYAAANQDAIYRMITGNRPDNLREIVRALGGTRAVANLTGRSQRTVQRWITTTGRERIAPLGPTRRRPSTPHSSRPAPPGKAGSGSPTPGA